MACVEGRESQNACGQGTGIERHGCLCHDSPLAAAGSMRLHWNGYASQSDSTEGLQARLDKWDHTPPVLSHMLASIS